MVTDFYMFTSSHGSSWAGFKGEQCGHLPTGLHKVGAAIVVSREPY